MHVKSYPFFLALLTAPLFLLSQKINVEHLQSMKIRNIGPAGMSGRVTAIDVELRNDNVIYVGAASGGVWRSTNGGIDWQPIFDKEPVQAIGAIKINQNNPDEIWVGTGEGNPRNSQNSGEGIFKTIDGGKNWKRMGLEKTKTVHRILIHRDNPDVVFAGATGSAWGPNEDRGVFKTTDGGKTWRKVLFVNNQTGCADLVADPSNPNKLFAAMWEYGRKPWTFNSGGSGSGLYVSFDAGETWEKRTDKEGLPKGDLGRIGIAVAPSKPNIVYALVEAKENALYKSYDGGFKWQKMASADKDNANVGNRPFYYSEIYVDPKNENRVFSLWTFLSWSEDGGRTFRELAGWKIHLDHHAFWIHPQDPDFMVDGNDGGMNISRDGGKSWRFIENLPLAQFYHIDHDMSIPYRVGGGMQDNGSWVGPSQVWKSGGIRNSDWREVDFGDGFDVGFQPGDNRYCYAMSQGGNVSYIDIETGKSLFIKPTHPDSVELRFNWNAGFSLNPFHDCGVYYGSQFLHKTLDCGQSWEIISPDLTTNDTTKLHQDKSGGLTIDATNAENHCTIIAVAPSSKDEKVIWVGTDDGNLQLTRDGGRTWTNLSAAILAATNAAPTMRTPIPKKQDLQPGFWIPYIEASKRNSAEAFVVLNDYRRNDWRPFVYHTSDYGATFRRIADETQVNGHALAIVQDPEVPDLLWLGTDFGLYFSIDFGANWNKWTNDYPSVSTIDLKIHPREHDLVVGTFGRAAWILDDIRPIREIARSKGKLMEQEFKTFPAPDAYLAEYASYDGVRFTGDGHYAGDNRRSGAMLTFWVKPEAKPADKKTEKEAAPEAEPSEEKKEEGGEEKKDRKEKKVKVQIFDNDGNAVRTFSLKPDTCINRIYWSLNHDGVRFPSRREAKPDDDLPGGYSVLPGIYKVVMTYGDVKDSTSVTVHADPRLKFSRSDMIAQQAAYKDFYKTVEKAAEGYNRLQEAKKSIKLVNDALVNTPDSLKKDLAKLSKKLSETITALEKRFMVPEGLKGIQRDPDNIQGRLFDASGRIGASDGAPNQAARRLIEQTRREVSHILGDINRFIEQDFSEFRKKVEGTDYSLFKNFEPLKLD
jgi:photosystem II stability/assembly factor-like uncharacterized protein